MHIQEVHIRRQIQGACAAEHRVVVVLPMPCSYAFLNLDGPASAGVQTDRHESNRGWHESQRGQPVAVAVAGPMQEPDTKLYLEHESSCPRGWARLCLSACSAVGKQCKCLAAIIAASHKTH